MLRRILLDLSLCIAGGAIAVGLLVVAPHYLLRPASLAPVTIGPLTAPAALDCVLTIHERDQAIGQAIPVSRWEMLTPNHAVSRDMSWHGKGTYGVARLLSRSPNRDMAILYSDTPLPCAIEISDEMPESQERLWWKILVPGGEVVPMQGRYVGIDVRDGDMVVDGLIYPGTSGSVLMRDSGKAVGVIHGAAPMMGPYRYFRSVGYASPIVGKRGALYTLLSQIGVAR